MPSEHLLHNAISNQQLTGSGKNAGYSSLSLGALMPQQGVTRAANMATEHTGKKKVSSFIAVAGREMGRRLDVSVPK